MRHKVRATYCSAGSAIISANINTATSNDTKPTYNNTHTQPDDAATQLGWMDGVEFNAPLDTI